MYNYLVGNEDDLSAYWKMNEGNGIIINDASINNNNGNIINSIYDWGINFSNVLRVKDNNENTEVPKFTLSQNYPNPFNPTTIIKYSLLDEKENNSYVTKVELKVYDLLGREVASLVNQAQKGGSYTVQFDALKLISGVYFYRMVAGSFSETKKMIFIR